MFPLGRFQPAALIVTCGLLTASVPPSSAADLETFVSEAGGYQVALPRSWHHKEIPGNGTYQAALSREKVEKQGDLYTYGLSILRLRDYRDMMEFSTRNSSEMAWEYANRLAASFEGGQNVLIALPTTGHGMDMSLFRIVAGGGTDDCLSMWLLVGVKGKQWFHALWEIPCSDREAHEDEINQMLESLVVDPKWAKRKG